jgi:hypothetical protein
VCLIYSQIWLNLPLDDRQFGFDFCFKIENLSKDGLTDRPQVKQVLGSCTHEYKSIQSRFDRLHDFRDLGRNNRQHLDLNPIELVKTSPSSGLRQARKHCARHFVVDAIRAIEHNNIPEKGTTKTNQQLSSHTHTHTNVENFGHFSNKIIGKFFGFFWLF